VTVQIVLLAAALAGAEAVRSYRRDPRGRRSSERRVPTALMVSAGRRLAGRLPGRLGAPPDPALVRRAGSPVAPIDVPAARAGSIVAFASLAVVGALAAGGILALLIGAGFVAFGAAYPDLWLRALAKRRTGQIERAAPALLELVAAGVEAGVPLDVALAGAAQAAGGELAEELERSRVAIALGRPRSEEFRDLGERTGAPTLASLGLALRLSDRLGVPLAASLRDQADRSRAEAARAVQERAAKAGPRVLAVVVFVLVPAALLPIAAAVALTVVGALGTGR
jgi:Flp pilus assembly protein TadB